MALSSFHPTVRRWFESRLGNPTLPQVAAVGRWSRFRAMDDEAPTDVASPEQIEFVARQLLKRYGIVVRKVLARERFKFPWRDMLRVFRSLELRGEVRGGRFVQGCDGEHFALDEAVALLRKIRKRDAAPLTVTATDPLNLRGILTPDERVSSHTQSWVSVL